MDSSFFYSYSKKCGVKYKPNQPWVKYGQTHLMGCFDPVVALLWTGFVHISLFGLFPLFHPSRSDICEWKQWVNYILNLFTPLSTERKNDFHWMTSLVWGHEFKCLSLLVFASHKKICALLQSSTLEKYLRKMPTKAFLYTTPRIACVTATQLLSFFLLLLLK